jgi:hypothetical protein
VLPSEDFSFENYLLQEIKKNKDKNFPCGIIFMQNIKKIISWHIISWDRQTDGDRGQREAREAA